MAGRLTISTLNNDTGVLATQNGMTNIPKAWCTFTIPSNGGAITIQTGQNISSITKVATGAFLVNFTVAMADVNYAPEICCSRGLNNNNHMNVILFANNSAGNYTVPTTSAFYFVTLHSGNNVLQDCDRTCIIVNGN
jgi:hypothetical protein